MIVVGWRHKHHLTPTRQGRRQTMRSIGLTGGIASGKSTVVKQLQELGAATIDADILGHQTYEPGTEDL